MADTLTESTGSQSSWPSDDTAATAHDVLWEAYTTDKPVECDEITGDNKDDTAAVADGDSLACALCRIADMNFAASAALRNSTNQDPGTCAVVVNGGFDATLESGACVAERTGVECAGIACVTGGVPLYARDRNRADTTSGTAMLWIETDATGRVHKRPCTRQQLVNCYHTTSRARASTFELGLIQRNHVLIETNACKQKTRTEHVLHAL